MKGCERDPRKEQVTMEDRSERDSVFKQTKERKYFITKISI
jgi:hypothetical protein